MPSRSLCFRVNDDWDVVAKEGNAAMHGISQFASRVSLPVHLWISIGRAGGGHEKEFDGTFLAAAVSISRHNLKICGTITWFCHHGSGVWEESAVKDMVEVEMHRLQE